MPTIDRLDADVLRPLTADVRAWVAEMAEMLSVSRNTAQLRMTRLMDTGVPTGFRPVIYFTAVGVSVQSTDTSGSTTSY